MQHNNIFRRIGILIFILITCLSLVFIIVTYLSASYFFNATTQLLNKDVAAHIAKFTSPFEEGGINRHKADSIFYNAMVISPSIEVYFLDTTGKVIYYEAPDSAIRLWRIPLQNINKLISSKGESYTTAPDPKNPDQLKIFSAAEVYSHAKKLGYIYVILGGKEYSTVNELLFKSHLSSLVIQVFFIILLISALISLYYIRRLQRKYNYIIGVLNDYLAGNLQARFRNDRYDEFAPIILSFNTMAEQLSNKIKQLHNAESERKHFIANISHDLRTPLAIASGYTETMLEKTDESKPAGQQQKYLQLVNAKLKQVEEMVMQLFELSRMEAVDFTPEREPFVFSEILQENVAAFQIAADKKRIQLACIGCEELSWVNADIKMMERVVQNLLENAIKNAPEEGRIRITLFRRNNLLSATFQNAGEPLPEAFIHKINNKENIGSPYARRNGKTGLGLAIVMRILHLHGYDFKASSHPDDGNSFTFTMDVIEANK